VGGGKRGKYTPPPNYFIYAKNSLVFGNCVEEGQINFDVSMGESGVCILRTGSKQSLFSF
jgi:hypothetical protein